MVRGGRESSLGILEGGSAAMLPKTCSSLTYADKSKNIHFLFEKSGPTKRPTLFSVRLDSSERQSLH